MPIQQTYYINAPSFASATGVFIDSGLTQCAPDGFYSEGTVIRQQVGCILYPPITCPACALSCDDAASYDGSGFGNFIINLGSPNDGAIVVTVTLNNDIPIGILGEYNGSTFRQLSSPIYGELRGSYINKPTYIGTTAQGTVCTLPNKNIQVQDYFWNGSSFVITGSSQFIQALSGQLDLTATNPSVCVMVIGKPPGGPDNYSINVVGLCNGGDWTITASCPQILPRITGTAGYNFPTQVPCPGIGTVNSYYIVSVGNATFPTLGLYDWVFTDQYGSSVAADGWYRFPNNLTAPFTLVRIENGLIVQIEECICNDPSNPGHCA